ncbi:MAG: aldehyde ferredoxin oxidoreductase [Deltaproteobacteria bacterium CG_4_8_14_3_um_filter_45_9]|nr:MAG: aldehyde ferredoxin oxidoreductase [Deltaproteobacteria bacterium CG03_land_8_20_14_0_80_45_14]PIX22838.1 MAG: aldehyde ferredoxin oxidoreductase [Deltaproteobacteria bacterium CG_4_8_14_3_um_filter_45_9]
MYGWRGKVLRVDLSRKEIREEKLDPQVLKDFVGGRGVGIYYLIREMDPLSDPLGDENLLIMAAGPLTGTRAPTGARYMVMTKSPLTGAVTCSNSSGFFPAELKKTGLDMIIFHGKAQEPVYLWIYGDHAELRPASHLWGKSTHETHDALLSEADLKARVACIGPAGERMVRFASIMNDRDRAAGRSGVGAVMGSKRLKAVVVRGKGEVPIWDEAGFKEICRGYYEKFQEGQKGQPSALRLHGTAVTVMATQNHGVFPTRNFQQGTFEGWEAIHGETLTRKYLVSSKACFNCPIACGRVTRVTEPPFEGEGEGPEYETIYAFGSNCGVDSLSAVTKANYICNEMGMDTISMGTTMACAMELSERGYLPDADIGRPLRFGDKEAIVELTKLTALRKGFGDILAEGSLRMAQKYGHPELAMVSKGQEFAGYDPRGEQGMGLAYATSNIGASHMRGDLAYIELLGVPILIDPLTWKDKPAIVKDFQDVFAIIDSAGLCVFFTIRNLVSPTRDIRPIGILELVNSATGAGYDMATLTRAGERIINLERLFLVRAGFSRKDDQLPPRILQEPLPDGPAKGMVCHLDEMLIRYYQLRGWNQNGIPTEAKLRELGLEKVAEDLEKLGKI